MAPALAVLFARGMKLSRPFACAVLVSLSACSSSSSTPTTTPDAGSSQPEAAAPVSGDMAQATFACTDPGVGGSPPTNWSPTLAASTVERCIQLGSSLSVQLEGADFFYLGIAGFDGVGTYTADAEEGTFVNLRARGGATGTPGEVTDVGTSKGECPASCTIQVTEATVKDAAVGATGSFVATVDCPTLAGAAVGCVTCTPSPTTVAKISISDCRHDQ